MLDLHWRTTTLFDRARTAENAATIISYEVISTFVSRARFIKQNKTRIITNEGSNNSEGNSRCHFTLS